MMNLRSQIIATNTFRNRAAFSVAKQGIAGRKGLSSCGDKCACQHTVAYSGILFGGGGGFQQIQLRTEDRQNGDLGGGSPIVRGSGDHCNLVQEISFHIVTFS